MIILQKKDCDYKIRNIYWLLPARHGCSRGSKKIHERIQILGDQQKFW